MMTQNSIRLVLVGATVLGIAVGLSSGCTTTPPVIAAATPYPGATWTPPDAEYSMEIEHDVQVTMSDGVVLVGDLAYPTDLASGERAKGTFPVILTQNPYGANVPPESGEIFVTHGYLFASIDVRGTTRSGGEQVVFEPRAAMDGAELATWASKLGGSNGQVGLWGCSYLGINQLEAATQLGPNSPVKAMIPACMSGDFYRDTLFDNGIASPVGKVWPGVWEEASVGGDMGYYRDYWQTRDRIARGEAIAKTGIPVLLWVGWQEGGSIGALEMYAVLQNAAAGRSPFGAMAPGDQVSGKYQVIIGDWAHGGGLDPGIELQWYDTWLKGLDTGIPTRTRTPLHLFDLSARRWVNASTYPMTDSYTRLYLGDNGILTREVGAEGADELTWAPQGQPGSTLTYTGDAFTTAATLAGPVTVELSLSSSNTEAQLLVELLDVAPDDTAVRINHGSLLASRRATNDVKSWADAHGVTTRPYLRLDRDEPLVAGETVQLDVPLQPRVWTIERGHRVQLRISTQALEEECEVAIGQLPLACNLTDPMLAALPGGVYTIHHGKASVSSVNLPLVRPDTLTDSASASSPTNRDETPLPIDW